MFRAVTYVLEPTNRQRQALERALEVCREVYNAALDERRGTWQQNRRRVSRNDQFRQLTELRGVRDDIFAFGLVVLRGALTRLDRAFQGFYRRVGAGRMPGYPRFKNRVRFDSLEYPDRSCWQVHDQAHRLYLYGIGNVRLRLHRALPGVPKTLTVRRVGPKKWRAVVFCEVPQPEPLPSTGRQVGVDMGVASLVTTSDGERIANPRHVARCAQRLAQAQRLVAGRRRRSGRRRRAVEQVAAIHRKIANQRRDHHHQLSRQLINRYDLIVYENLHITSMVRSARGTVDAPGVNVAAKRGLNRSLTDAGWGQLLRFLSYKAEEAGRTLITVDARHTSQRCSQCGHVSKENRPSQATFRCQACTHQAHADVNAAINILRAGLAQRHAREAGEQLA